MKPGRAILAVDGAAKGNPGPAGIGVVISDESGKVLKEIGSHIGRATNNFAEYTALIRGLSEVREMGFSEVAVYTDSELMQRQIAGRYKVKSPGLQPLYQSAVDLIHGFDDASVYHVPREKNKAADNLASAAAERSEQPGLFDGSDEKPRRPGKQARSGGKSMIKRISIDTSARTQFIDITDRIQEVVQASGVKEGNCTVFVTHTTSGVTINESVDPYVLRDIIDILNGLVPRLGSYQHAQGNADAHAKASLIGSSIDVIVEDGRLLLGEYQVIYLCEFDGPRPRQVVVRVA